MSIIFNTSGPLPVSVAPLTNYTYTVTVANQGPSTASNVVVSDALPPGVTFLSASAGGTTNASGAVYWPPIATWPIAIPPESHAPTRRRPA